MTKKNFEVNDKIGRYTLTEFGGTNDKQEPLWWATTDSSSNQRLVPESRLRKELRLAELTPALIRGLSSKAYDQLRFEVGEEEINRVLNRNPKVIAPPIDEQLKIARSWWDVHPQIPRTKKNVTIFDDYLAKLPDATFSAADFDRAFSDLFFKLELDPTKAGIEGFGEAIRGEAAVGKLSSGQIKQLQKSFPIVVPVDFSKLSEDETIKEAGKLLPTSKQFLEWTKEVDKAKGIEQPVPPLMAAAREKTWASFFEIHPRVVPTEDIKVKLLSLLKANSEFNSSNESLPVLNQYLDSALEFLVQSGGEVEIYLEPNTHTSGGSRWIVNEPRPIGAPVPRFDDTPVEVTLADVNAMPAAEYAQKSLNPAFRQAVDRLTARFAG